MKKKHCARIVLLTVCCLSLSVQGSWTYSDVTTGTGSGDSVSGADIVWGWLASSGGVYASADVTNMWGTTTMHKTVSQTVSRTVKYTSSVNPPTDCPYFTLRVEGTCLYSTGGATDAHCETNNTADQSAATESGEITVSGEPFELKDEANAWAKSKQEATLLNVASDGKKISSGGEITLTVNPLAWSGSVKYTTSNKSNPCNAIGLEASANTSVNITKAYNFATETKVPEVESTVGFSASITINAKATSGGQVKGHTISNVDISKCEITKT